MFDLSTVDELGWFGKIIVKTCKEKGVTLDQLRTHLRYTPTQFRVFLGRSSHNFKTVKKLCYVLAIRIDSLPVSRIDKILIRKGMTMSDLAIRMEMNIANISKMLNRIREGRKITKRNKEKLCEVLKVKYDEDLFVCD